MSKDSTAPLCSTIDPMPYTFALFWQNGLFALRTHPFDDNDTLKDDTAETNCGAHLKTWKTIWKPARVRINGRNIVFQLFVVFAIRARISVLRSSFRQTLEHCIHTWRLLMMTTDVRDHRCVLIAFDTTLVRTIHTFPKSALKCGKCFKTSSFDWHVKQSLIDWDPNISVRISKYIDMFIVLMREEFGFIANHTERSLNMINLVHIMLIEYQYMYICVYIEYYLLQPKILGSRSNMEKPFVYSLIGRIR